MKFPRRLAMVVLILMACIIGYWSYLQSRYYISTGFVLENGRYASADVSDWVSSGGRFIHVRPISDPDALASAFVLKNAPAISDDEAWKKINRAMGELIQKLGFEPGLKSVDLRQNVAYLYSWSLDGNLRLHSFVVYFKNSSGATLKVYPNIVSDDTAQEKSGTLNSIFLCNQWHESCPVERFSKIGGNSLSID